MATIFQIVLAVLLMWGPSLSFAAENGSMATVKTIQFEEQDGVERVVIGLSGEVETKIFELPGENPRVVCDLLHTGYPANLRRVISVRGDLASRIRVGIHTTPVVKTRIVIDLVADIPYSFEHSFRKEDTSLVLTLSKRTEAKPIAELLSELKKKKTAVSETPAKSQAVEPQKAQAVESQHEETRQSSDDGVMKREKADVEEGKEPVEGLQEEMEVKQERTNVLNADGEDRSGIVDEDIPVLLDVSFERNTNDKEMVLFRLSGFHPPVIFSTEDDDLLVVCDFLDALLGYGIEPVLETGGKYISTVRISKHASPDKVRVVLDLVDKYNYDLKQVFFREDNLFVVIISNLGEKKL